MYTGQSKHSVTVNDGGTMHISSFCDGPWNMKQARALRQCIIRRKLMEVALYVRGSTSRQQQQQTIDQQLSRLRDYVATHPDWYVAEEHIYRDDGYSGATLNRPGLDRLRDRAAMAAFECILSTAPDRLARNYVHQMLLVDELTQRGCRVEFVERPMSDDPHDQLLLQIRSAVAEYERTLIAERMRRGRQAKLRSGQLLPWTRAPYGYLLDPDRPRDASRVQLDPVQAAVVAHMFAWYTDPRQSVSLYAVAKRLSDAHIPTPRGGKRWNVASIRGILRSPTYIGVAYSGRTRPAPSRRRKSTLQPVGPGQSQQPTAAEEWIAVPVPAIMSQDTFEAAQSRLDRNVQMARRHNTTYEYLLRSLVSCGQCRLACSGRTLSPGYHYYFCRGRTDSLRLAQGERCTARYAPAHALDDLVWRDLCRVLKEPRLITHELERAQMGEWLPQALQARRQTLRDVLAQLERQQARLLDLYLAEVLEREEFERRRKEVTQTQQGLRQQLRQLDAQAQQHVNVAALAQGIETFCQRMQPTLDHLTFAQRRQRVELLIDCVIVNDAQVEIRSVVPTGPTGETTPFCHVRLDYLHGPAGAILAQDVLRAQGEIGGEKGFEGWGWFSLPMLFEGGFASTPQHHDPHEAPRQHRVPQTIPGLDCGARFAGVGHPPRGGLRQGCGRANQVAFFARGVTPLGSRG
jgi:site-specific DNA recombinase